MTSQRVRQAGFTQVELMVTVAIVSVLAAVAVNQVRDYVRRASLSEVVLAVNRCKNVVSENYALLEEAPEAGEWGCESGHSGNYSGAIETSTNGVVRVAIANIDNRVNGHYVYLAPARADSSPMYTPHDLGRNVSAWICGSDWMLLRNSLPANCRSDTTTFASQDFD